MRHLFLVIIICMLLGCSMPSTTVRTIDTRPTISVQGGPKDSEVFIDGIKVGTSGDFDGRPNVLLIEKGTHQIIIKSHGQVILHQTFFAENELKTFNIK